MAEISLEKIESNSFKEDISYQENNSSEEKKRKYSLNSSKSDSFFDYLNSEIKDFIEKEEDISFSSNSNSESQEQQMKIDDLLDTKYWKVNKDLNYENEKGIFSKKKNILLLNENEKKLDKDFEMNNNGYKNKKVTLSEENNKQSTQSNEDDETRSEHLHNMSDSDSSNSHSITLVNNNNEENENHCSKLDNLLNGDKSPNKDLENKNKNQLKETEKEDNKENIKNSKIIMNKYNTVNNGTEFMNPYDQLKIQNNNSGFSTFFPGSFLNQPIYNYNSSYNLPSPLSNRSIISINSNNNNKMNNNYSQNNEEAYLKKENKNNINGQNNKYNNINNNNYGKKINQNQKGLIDLPLIINQNNGQNLQMNYTCSKLNLNVTYYPKIQNNNISNPKQSGDKINNSSNYLPELNNKNNLSTTNLNNNINNNLSEKKTKNNTTLNLNEQNNSMDFTNINNNLNNMMYNKMKMNYKNLATNKNMNNNLVNKTSSKGEKQILNLDDIVTGKDTRTTIMIRNIPIKYTDEILNESLKEFHGKYDCLYLPFDYEKNGNKGYAFINFVNPLHILYFYEKFNGKKWAHFESSKICELNSAHFQGVNEIQKHAKNYKDLAKSNCYSDKEENLIIPSKYLFKLKKRFPKMQYTENLAKKIILIKSLE